ncbi:MAG TPA: hypothetical protein VIS99_05660 [Terrimicrobiaceae bacterium]
MTAHLFNISFEEWYDERGSSGLIPDRPPSLNPEANKRMESGVTLAKRATMEIEYSMLR